MEMAICTDLDSIDVTQAPPCEVDTRAHHSSLFCFSFVVFFVVFFCCGCLCVNYISLFIYIIVYKNTSIQHTPLDHGAAQRLVLSTDVE